MKAGKTILGLGVRGLTMPGLAILGLAVSGVVHAQDTIRVLAPTWVGFAPALVAGDLGYYEEEGLEVDFRFEDDRANVLAAMERGDIDADMRTVGEHQGAPRTDDTPGIIIGTIDLSLGGDGVLVDGSIDSVADLQGKLVAIEPNIPARLLLQMELKKAGLSLDDVELRQIATADTIAVLSDDSISAVGTYEPFLSQALTAVAERNPKILVSSKDEPDLIIDIITAREDDLAENPAKYQKFLRGIYRAVDYFQQDPKSFAALAAPHYGLSADEVTEIIDTSLAYTSYEQSLEFLGTPDAPGTLYGFFDQIMELNIEFGASEVTLDAAKEIDAAVLTGLFDGAAR
ncbi:MAG: ABC transporter substrate-binding protein [Granulosicoccus sp.]